MSSYYVLIWICSSLLLSILYMLTIKIILYISGTKSEQNLFGVTFILFSFLPIIICVIFLMIIYAFLLKISKRYK